MRQEHETATSFNQLKAITQIMQTQKPRAQTSENTNASEPTQKTTLKPKASLKAKKGALKPTKRAFSERQITAFRDNSHARNKSQETKQANQQGDNANAFKTDQANNQENQKGGSDE
ncbi:hypothetical protein [Helicobacter pylori]|uniref:hypothetical protein n=1 Tax=Helicobacter pylori TaxID=210 RepID=UPI000574676B|nr:hypothetical protein [Helicobacter pylori]ANT42560.1 hypothetical protein [Helicobacter phage Pt1846U]KHL83691.1 hypothetical protein HPY1846_02540 [Helicobacter pylori]MCQ2823348.1 hypothetical protein [Helicobacter pylori]